MSQHHVVSCTPEHCHWGFFDAGLKPVVVAASGDTVHFECVSGGPEVMPPDSFQLAARAFDRMEEEPRVERSRPGARPAAPAALGLRRIRAAVAI